MEERRNRHVRKREVRRGAEHGHESSGCHSASPGRGTSVLGCYGLGQPLGAQSEPGHPPLPSFLSFFSPLPTVVFRCLSEGPDTSSPPPLPRGGSRLGKRGESSGPGLRTETGEVRVLPLRVPHGASRDFHLGCSL